MTTVTATTVSAQSDARDRRARSIGLVVAVAVLAILVALSLAIGSRAIPLNVVWDALIGGRDGSIDVDVVLDRRLPRTAVAVLAGIGLGVAGGVIQAVSRNALADPGILGVTAGSAFAVAIAVGVLGITAVLGYLAFAFLGAFVAAVVVYLIGSNGPGGVSPARLTLAGVAFGAILSGITSSMVLADPASFSVMRAWESGSLQDRGWDLAGPAAPFIAVGIVLALAITPALNAIALGDDHATALGANVTLIRTVAIVAVTVLAGSATAIAGPIAFLGLMVPHVVRWIVGPDQRWILSYSVVVAPSLLLAADIIGRVVARPSELPAGLVTAAIGAPMLIYLVRRPTATGL